MIPADYILSGAKLPADYIGKTLRFCGAFERILPPERFRSPKSGCIGVREPKFDPEKRLAGHFAPQRAESTSSDAVAR
jgi:hypothetical protein